MIVENRVNPIQYLQQDSNVLRNPIGVKKHPWSPQKIITQPESIISPTKNREKIKQILYHDMVSEYDARLFSEYVHQSNLVLSQEFKNVDGLWQIDEDNHYKGFKIINKAIFGLTTEDIKQIHARVANFEPLSHLFTDELPMMLTVAYDELCTVRAYKKDLPIYDDMGDQVGNFVRRVIADEGWHYSKFLRLIKRYHQNRIDEAVTLVDVVRASEGIPYKQTFVLDHTEDVFTEDLFDESAYILKKHLKK